MNHSEPFPQANNLEKVISLLNVDKEENLAVNAVLEPLLGVSNSRQVCYYLSAGRYIGFIGEGRTFSELGHKLRSMCPTEQKAEIARIIVADPVFGTVYFRQKMLGFIFDHDDITSIMKACGVIMETEKMYIRRGSTISSWIKAIYEMEQEMM